MVNQGLANATIFVCLAAGVTGLVIGIYHLAEIAESDCVNARQWHNDQITYWTTVNETRAQWHKIQAQRFGNAEWNNGDCSWWNETVPWS